ncbi:hypothetical protein LAZ67_6002430, partial [Cordylochernes scorpioides]
MYARRPKVCIPLTAIQKRARLNWCRQHLGPEKSGLLFFLDESRFSRNTDSRRVRNRDSTILLTSEKGTATVAKVSWSGVVSRSHRRKVRRSDGNNGKKARSKRERTGRRKTGGDRPRDNCAPSGRRQPAVNAPDPVKISDGAESAIPPFDGAYSATQFFPDVRPKNGRRIHGEQEKLLRLPNYLVRQPLELFRKLRLADRSYFQVRQILLDLYPESSEASFAKYFAMKLTGQANLETYYREKTAMGLQLGLPQEVILETLTEGLPFNDQRLVRVVPPENLGEWFRLVQRIHGPSVPTTRPREDQPPTMSVRTTAHPDAQVHGMHLFRRPTASSAARDTGTSNADVDQSRRPTRKSGQCKRLHITAGTITPLTRNTDIIHAIKQPHNRKTLQSFLGAVNVYNKFIPEYARLRAPLNNLLKKDVVWNWNEVCQKAFIDLKGNLTQHPILHLYKEGLPCQVYCDASTLGIAGILKQVHPDGNVYPVQYFSRTLRPHEKNYSISELECLAIVESVEKFRIYLMGRKFTIFSDHHALQWLKTIKNPSGRLFRWSLRLSSYEYEVRYIKGKLQYEADLLSRNPFCGFLDATLIKTHQPPPSKESSLTIDHNGLHTVSRKGVTKIILPKPLIQQLLQTVPHNTITPVFHKCHESSPHNITGKAESPSAAAPSSGTRGAGATRRPRSSTGWAPRAEEVWTTRAHIAEARARQASSTEDHCVYIERSPELEPYHYMRALDRMLGGTREVFQMTKMNGHFLVGLANRGLAERLVNKGLEVEGTLHRAFPFRKRAERITVGNLPFFVGDAAVISALSPFGRVTSIAPKLMKAGPYIYNDGRREAFIILREGMTIERLPTRLDISIKGETWPAYLSSGIRCSRCRAKDIAGPTAPCSQGEPPNLDRPHPPLPPATAPRLTQQPSAQPPPPASPSPTMEVSDVPPASRAATLPSAALRPSPPAPSALPVEDAPPAPPPVTPAPSLQAPGGPAQRTLGPAAPTLDVEMSIVEVTSASSTSSAKNATRVDLDAFIEKHPSVSFAGTDALGLGREEVLDLLSSRTKAQRKGPLLSPPQCDALAGLIGKILDLRPGAASNLYKVLGQVKAELRTTPAVPPTPPLPAPRPSGPTPPTSHSEELMPAVMTPPPPALEDNPDLTQWKMSQSLYFPQELEILDQRDRNLKPHHHHPKKVTIGSAVQFIEFEPSEEPEALSSRARIEMAEESFFVKSSKEFTIPSCPPPTPRRILFLPPRTKPPYHIGRMLQDAADWLELHNHLQARRMKARLLRKERKEFLYEMRYRNSELELRQLEAEDPLPPPPPFPVPLLLIPPVLLLPISPVPSLRLPPFPSPSFSSLPSSSSPSLQSPPSASPLSRPPPSHLSRSPPHLPSPSFSSLPSSSFPSLQSPPPSPAALRQPPPAPSALPAEDAPPAPPPVTPAPSLRTPGSREPAAPTPDVEMSIVEETSTSSTSSAKNATRIDLDAFIERHPSVSFAETDALGLGWEEVLDLLSSRTKAQRNGPLLPPPQCDALAGLIRQILDLRPGAASNLYKVLGQVKAELRTTPAAVPTPPPPAPRPAETTSPALHGERTSPDIATPPPPLSTQFIDACYDQAGDIIYALSRERFSEPLSNIGVTEGDIVEAIIFPEDREPLFRRLSTQKRTTLAEIISAASECARNSDPFVREGLRILSEMLPPPPNLIGNISAIKEDIKDKLNEEHSVKFANKGQVMICQDFWEETHYSRYDEFTRNVENIVPGHGGVVTACTVSTPHVYTCSTRPWWVVTACTVSTPHVYTCSTRPWWVVTACTVSTPHVYTCSTRPWWVVTACTYQAMVGSDCLYCKYTTCLHSAVRPRVARAPEFFASGGRKVSRMATNMVWAESPSKAEDKPVRLGSKAQPSAEITAKDVLQNKNPIVLTKNQNYVNPSAGSQDANSAAPVDLAANPTSDAAAQVRRNWADITEEVNPGAEEGFTLVQGRKRRRGSANSPTAAAPSSNPGGSRTIRRPQPSAGSVPRAQEIRVTRAHIAEARARQASSSEEHCVYIEHSPELEPFHYLRALDRMLGGTAGVIQITKARPGLRTCPRASGVPGATDKGIGGPFAPLLAGLANNTRMAPPTTPAGVPPPTTPAPPQRSAAQPPAPTPSNPAMEVCSAPPVARAALHSSAPRPSPPAAPAYPMEETPPAPPPVTPASSLRTPGSREPAAPTPDVEMSIVEETFASSTSSAKNATRVDLDAFIEKHPSVSFAGTDALGLGREEVLDLLSSRTKTQRKGPLLSPPQCDALAGLIRKILNLKPGAASNLYKVLGQVKAELRTTPAAVPPTPPLPAPRPAEPMLPTTHREELTPPLMTPPPPAPTDMEEDDPITEEEHCAPPPPAPRLAGPIPPVPHGDTTTPAMTTPPPPLSLDRRWKMTGDLIHELSREIDLEHTFQTQVDMDDIVRAVLYPGDREPFIKRLPTRDRYILSGFIHTAIWRARDGDPSMLEKRNSNSFEKKSKLCKSARRRPGCKFCRAGRPLSLATNPTSNAAAQVRRNWADITEEVNPGAEEGFTLVQGRKRRRGSANSPTAAAPSSNPGGSRTIRRPQPSAGSVPRAQEIRVTRAHIAEARARQASSSEEHCVYIEHSPELEPFHYLRALDRMLGGTAGVIQITKVNGHQLLGLTNRGLAERLISEGLEVEGTLLRAFPFRKRAERITVGNLPFFVADSAVITALSPYGRVTSIAPKQMKAGPYVYVDGRRDVFITLHEGITIERLPTRLDINIKGQAWPAYLSSGIRCSRCHGQGHRRAICPLLTGLANNTRTAPPTTPAGVPPPTTPAPPQRSAAQPPAPTPSNPAMEVCSAPPVARAALHSSAPRPSPPAAPAFPMEETPPAPPPVTPAPSLQTPGSREPAAPTPDVEMSIVEETFASSTSSAKNATRVDLDAFIEGLPSVSFAKTDALGLGREEVLDLLSSRTKAQRKGPLLSPPQCDALVGLIGQILDLKPGHTSNLYKVLGQVKAELRTTPAVPPTPTLPAPWPAKPTPPALHGEKTSPDIATPPPPLSTEFIDACYDQANDIIYELSDERYLETLSDIGVTEGDIVEAIIFPDDREPLLRRLSTQKRTTLAGIVSAASERARSSDPFVREGLRILSEMLPPPPLICGRKVSRMATNFIRAESPSKAEQKPVRHGEKAQPCAELSKKEDFQKKTSNLFNKNQNYANPPAGGHHANPATPTDFVTASFSEAAAQANRSWADLAEDNNQESEEPFITVQRKKRRRGSAESPAAAAPSSNIRGAGAIRRPRSSTGWAPRAEEIRTTRAHIAEARARQASSTEDHCVYVERSPELEPFHYMRAIERMFGGTREVFQLTKMNGHFLVGLANRGMAERLINEGLEVEGTLHRAFPFRKRAERITVGNLPFFVGDAAVISALSSFGRVTSIAPKLMKAGPYIFNDGRREAFIIFREGMTIERLPTRLDITIKGEAWPAYLSSGIRCSRCRGQGHRRANCPLLAGIANNTRLAPPTTPAAVPSTTTSATPQRSAAQPPTSASSSPARETLGTSPAARAVTTSTAPRPSPPVAPAVPMEEAPSTPPPVTPAPSLQAPGGPAQRTLGSAAPTPDVEMSIVEETFASSTSSAKNATRVDLDAFIEGHPSVSFAETDALGLGREEVLDLLSSRTKAQRKGPLLSPPQCDALVGVIGQILNLRPGAASNLYKVLGQVKAELRTTPAEPPTPPLPAPRPSGPTPPTPHSEELMPAVMTPPPPALEDNPDLDQWEMPLSLPWWVVTACTVSKPHVYTRPCGHALRELPSFSPLASGITSRMATNLARAESPSKAEDKPVRLGSKAQPCAEITAKDVLQNKNPIVLTKNQNYVNPSAGSQDANSAAPVDLAAIPTSDAAAQVRRNWADITEEVNPGAEEGFTLVQGRKRRRGSANSPTAAAPSSNPGGSRTIRRPQPSAGSVPRAQEIRVTRAHIAEARARQASSSEEHCVYIEHSPELEPFHYLRALDRMLGGTAGVIQITKVNGHQLLGLTNRGLAERLISEGLEVEGTLLRAFPFRKRAERITVGNLPFFVADSAVITALSPYGRVTSIAPKQMKAGPYVYVDGRRDVFITLHEGITIERLPTRLDINIKGQAWPAYLSSGIRCSRCHGQGHRRAICPLLAGLANNTRTAPPTTPAGVPPPTTPAPPQRLAAQPPAPTPSNPAMEVCSAPPVARAALHSSAPRPSPPAAPAFPMEETPPAPPPVTPAPSLQTPGSREPAAPTPDVEMSIVEETFASSTSSAKNATRVDLDAFIEGLPSVSFAKTDALGLGREEVLDLLSSRTKAQRKGPLLSPPQCDALVGLIGQILDLKPGHTSNLYKVLGQVKAELRTTPAVPPTPPLPAPRPSGPTPPTSHSEELMPAVMTPPPPALEDDPDLTQWQMTIRRPQPSAGSVPRAQEIRVTRAHIAEARARQGSSSEENCVYIEHSPELEPFHYLKALDRMLGGTAGVIQITKVNGHQLLGLTNRGLAERLISGGLEVEGTLLRAFLFRKRAERITVGNLPFFVGDSAVINALSPYGRVTSIAPKQMKAGPYVYVDGRRDIFITLHEGITIERLPTRLDINIKGEAWPAYLSSGIRCSRCHGQGHRRAICPLLAGLANNTRMAPPTTPAGVPPPTTPAPPQRSAAQPPAPAPSNPAMEVCSAPPVARAVLHPSAPRPSPPAAPALPMEETLSAPPRGPSGLQPQHRTWKCPSWRRPLRPPRHRQRTQQESTSMRSSRSTPAYFPQELEILDQRDRNLKPHHHHPKKVTIGSAVQFIEFEPSEEPEALSSRAWIEMAEESFFVKSSKEFTIPSCPPPTPRRIFFLPPRTKPPYHIGRMLQDAADRLELHNHLQARRMKARLLRKERKEFLYEMRFRNSELELRQLEAE